MKIKPKIFSASGNIFALIDNRGKQQYEKKYFIENISEFCSNKIKTDGLIVINSSTTHNFNASFFNPDGTYDMMCGNGGRTAIFYYAKTLKEYENNSIVSFEMNNQIYYGKINGSQSSIYFDLPNKIEYRTIIIDKIKYKGYFIDTGAPHLVIEVDNLSNIDVKKIGSKIRNHKKNGEKGTNVDFMQIISPNLINLRTFERGVEDETGACGTGAVATSAIYFIKNGYFGPIKIIPTSKEILFINIETLFGKLQIVLDGNVIEKC